MVITITLNVIYDDSGYSYMASLELILSNGDGGYLTTTDTLFYLENPVDIVSADINNDGFNDVLRNSNTDDFILVNLNDNHFN
jgi:hypothetical protein